MISHMIFKTSLLFSILNGISGREMNEIGSSMEQKSVGEPKNVRDEKVFSLFTIVTFPNDECTSKSGSSTGATYGTCLSSTECSSNSGTADGNCASGFGVCCIYKFSSCSSSVTKNCTYIQNPSYSSSYTTSGSCAFTVTPPNTNICQLRLDFTKFVTTQATTGACTDSFVAKGPTNSNGLQNLCGTLTGQHLYLEQGRSATASTLTFTIATTTTGATWNIKVSMIECSSSMRAPHDCQQWLTGSSGLLMSYGWKGGHVVTGSDYSSCIRRENGYCAIQYVPAQDGSTVSSYSSIDSFQVDPTAAAVNTNTITPTWTATLDGYVMISNDASGTSSHSGDTFGHTNAGTLDSAVFGYGPQFQVTHVASSTQIASGNSGFLLQYDQIPCGTQLQVNES